MLLDIKLAKQPLTALLTNYHQAEIKVSTLDPGLKIYLANKIKVYKNVLAIQKISDLVNKVLSI